MIKKHKKILKTINIHILGNNKRNSAYVFCNLTLKKMLAYSLYKVAQKKNQSLEQIVLDAIEAGFHLEKHRQIDKNL